jgi:hypothetical protein
VARQQREVAGLRGLERSLLPESAPSNLQGTGLGLGLALLRVQVLAMRVEDGVHHQFSVI